MDNLYGLFNLRGNVEMPQINKKEALEKLRKAKGAHIKWRAYAQPWYPAYKSVKKRYL
jgi:hypothetical protein